MKAANGSGSPAVMRAAAEPSAAPTSVAPRVVIIGGGLAGMAAASALASSPAHVTMLESRRRTGGRAGSFLEPSQQQEVDYCQHVAMGCCTNFLHLMNAHGLSGTFERISEIPFLSLDGEEWRFAPSRWLPAPLHFTPALSRLRFLSARQRGEVRAGIWRLMRSPAEHVSPETCFGQWLREQGQSRATIEKFWNVVIASALGEDTVRVAYAPARKVFVDGFLGARRAADLLIPRKPLSHLFGEQLPRSLQTVGVKIRTSTTASRLVIDPEGVTGVQTGDGLFIAADRVIVAVPWHATERLLPGSIPPFPASPITGVHLWFDRPITHHRQAVLIGGLSQWLFQPFSGIGADGARFRRGQETANGGKSYYYQVVVSASREVQRQGQEASVATICRELETTFPASRQARLLRWRVVTDPHAVFSASPETESQRPSLATDQPGVFLAGDYARTGWPATMEGAVISGYRAADAVRRSLQWNGFPSPPPLPRNWLARWLIR